MELSSHTSAIQRRTVRNAVPQADAQLVRGRGRLPAAIAMVMEYATVAEDRGLNHVGIVTGVVTVRPVMGEVVEIVLVVMDLAIAIGVGVVVREMLPRMPLLDMIGVVVVKGQENVLLVTGKEH